MSSTRGNVLSRDVGIDYYHKFCQTNSKERSKHKQRKPSGVLGPHFGGESSSIFSSSDVSSSPSARHRAGNMKSSNTEFVTREIPREIEKYFDRMRLLKNLLAETKAAFDEINQCGYFDFEDQESPQSMLDNDEINLSDELTKPPSIVILGQDNLAKATVVRELFSEDYLPMTQVDEDLEVQRALKFSYSHKSHYSVATIIRTRSVNSDFEILETQNENDDAQIGNSNQMTDSSTPQVSSMSSTSTGSGTSTFKSKIHNLARLRGDERLDPSLCMTVLEVKIPHSLLRERGEIIVGPCNNQFLTTMEFFKGYLSEIFPIVIYALSFEKLSVDDITELQQIREMKRDLSIFFIKTYPDSMNELTESAQDEMKNVLKQQLIDLGFLQPYSEDTPPVLILEEDDDEGLFSNKQDYDPQTMTLSTHMLARSKFDLKKAEVCSTLVDSIADMEQFVSFLVKSLRSHLSNLSTHLHNTHKYALKTFVATAYELSRDCQITPKRLQYTKEKELELFQSLMSIANKQQNEIKNIIVETIQNTRDDIIREATEFSLSASASSTSSFQEERIYRKEIEAMVINRINKKIAEKMIASVQKLNENFTGVLKRCLRNLEENKINGRRNRDLDEEEKENEIVDEKSARAALRKILNAAYSMELPAHLTGQSHNQSNFSFLDRLRELFMSHATTPPVLISEEYKAAVARNVLTSLNETKIARNYCQQFRATLQESHEQFMQAMKVLEHRQVMKLEKNEERRMQVRKNLAPKIARLAMDSLSLRDLSLFGMPKLDGEIGRGQYGVVYACQSGWGQWSSVAVKSLLPPDEKHWNDLAMEYHYTTSLPPHDRLVQIRGSVIDENYGGGLGQVAVLLIMDRYPRDLYTAIKARLPYSDRLQVALDVVDGLRFLHSQGLVHRDIKLKNILLDERNRGKITDLGFCKPEAMMSGSIVGTPIHMAPELLQGIYDHSVDTYAFGILFWYICAGTVKLPHNFEQCTSKEHLWQVVQKGVRPERLATFEDDCWRIMSECWATCPQNRPYLGLVRPQLDILTENARNRDPQESLPKRDSKLYSRLIAR